MGFIRAFIAAGIVGAVLPGAAQASLKICNETESAQSVAIGYKGDEGWTSEGWWNVEPGDCATVIAGDLQKRYFYYRAEIDGGDFEGESFMFCTTPEEFTIVGNSDCEARGQDSESFREIDTGEKATEFTFTLVATETAPKDAPETRADPEPAEEELGLRVCNETAFTQAVSIGYKGEEDWTSEGWWNIESGACATLLPGALQKRYYYYRAEVDGGDFDGENYYFCTSPQEYTIVGDTECTERGYDREAFRAIDTGETARSYTLTLVADDTPADDAAPAETGLDICNETEHVQSVSIAYKGAEDWVSEGWWVIDPGDCKTPVGTLASRYYYYRAEVDGGTFDGQGYYFCTTPEAYTITGNSDCEARGYDSEEFAEIDVGDYSKFIFTLVPPEQLDSPPAPATGAGLEICNDTGLPQVVAIGYKGAEDWTSEGWWSLAQGDCVRPALDGVNRRYVYYRAQTEGGSFEGQNYFFCTSPDAFTIVGDGECAERGYDREDFREIDTGSEEGMFTLTLVAPDTMPGPDAPMTEPMAVPEPEVAPDTGTGTMPEADSPALGGFDLPAEEPGEMAPEPEPEVELPEPAPEPRATPRRGGSRG